MHQDEGQCQPCHALTYIQLNDNSYWSDIYLDVIESPVQIIDCIFIQYSWVPTT